MLARFGSVARLREADAEEIAAVPGIGPKIASAVMAALSESSDEMLGAAPGEDPP
ncbi:MAG: helix-hairpin-helix domain-containing protein [Actinomycetota bacterium]